MIKRKKIGNFIIENYNKETHGNTKGDTTMTDKFTASLLYIESLNGMLTYFPDCIEAAGLVNLNALAMGLAERVRVLGEARHMLRDAEVTALAAALAPAAITAARLVNTVARRMREEEAGHADD